MTQKFYSYVKTPTYVNMYLFMYLCLSIYPLSIKYVCNKFKVALFIIVQNWKHHIRFSNTGRDASFYTYSRSGY